MDNLSVRLEQKSTSKLVGWLFLFMSLVIGTIACLDRDSVGVVEAILAVLCSVAAFMSAGNEQILDSEGIHIKTYFGKNHYPWEIVEKTRVVRLSSKDLPYIQFFIRGRKRTVLVYYTKRTLACLRYYYGEPDEVRVKEPPANV